MNVHQTVSQVIRGRNELNTWTMCGHGAARNLKMLKRTLDSAPSGFYLQHEAHSMHNLSGEGSNSLAWHGSHGSRVHISMERPASCGKGWSWKRRWANLQMSRHHAGSFHYHYHHHHRNRYLTGPLRMGMSSKLANVKM